MSRSRWILLACAPCFVGALLVVPTLRGAGPDAARSSAGSDEEETRGAAELVDVEARIGSDAGEDSVVTAPDEAPTERVAAGPAAEVAEPEPEPAADPPIMGVVTDADGVPVEGVTVGYVSDIDPLAALGTNVTLPLLDAVGVTDRKGVFVFEGTSRSSGGTFRFGEEILLTGPATAEVDTGVDWQVLRLPRIPRQDAVWTVEVVDPGGRPVAVESAELELVGEVEGVARRTWPHERVVSLGAVVQRGLPRATWRMHVAPEGSITRTVEWTVDAVDATETTRIVVDVGPGIYAQDVGPTLEGDGSSWVDPASGLLDWLPEDRVTVGEPALNRHFAQTLQFGSGSVRDAELRLRLRAMLYNADNDALYLEHRGVKDFVWRARIGDLVKKKWQKGATATLRLDLSRLPRKGDEPLDLRPYLEDGLLDVVVQDDTTIDDVSIRVVR